MCTLMTSVPRNSKSNGGVKKRNLLMSLKPCADEKTYYRVRLLGFLNEHTDRDDFCIVRYVHQKWGVNAEKGYPVLEDEITCPVTPHVHVEGNRYDSCKICNLANKYFIAFKESGWKDKEANKKSKEFGRKFQAIIPVYVVDNPNYDGDNGKFKVIVFNDKKFYEEFRKKVEKAAQTNMVFNGQNAVDCCIHVSNVTEVVNEGKPTEYTWKHKVIDKVVFTTKPYDIPSINKETLNSMGFDDEYYTTSTQDEIDLFYKKYCTISNDDIPDDDMPIYDEPKTSARAAAPVSVSNPIPVKNDIPEESFDVITSDADDNELPTGSSTSTANDDIDAEDLLKDLDDLDI